MAVEGVSHANSHSPGASYVSHNQFNSTTIYPETADSTGKCSVLEDTFHFRYQLQALVVPCASDGLAGDPEVGWDGGGVPSTRSSDFVNLLHWFTKPGETFYFLLDHWFYYYFGFIMEGSNSGGARREGHREQGMGRGVELPNPFHVFRHL